MVVLSLPHPQPCSTRSPTRISYVFVAPWTSPPQPPPHFHGHNFGAFSIVRGASVSEDLFGVGRSQKRYPARAHYGPTAPSLQLLQSRSSLLCRYGYLYSGRRCLHL